MNNNFPDIDIYRFRFLMKAKEDLTLPEYKGSMFRGAFGTTFRKIVCITKKQTCDDCFFSNQCSYFKIFETEIPDNNLNFLKNVKKVPHPFIIEPPLDNKRNFLKCDTLSTDLVIIGNTINSLPFFIYTFIKLGETGISYKRSKVDLISVQSLDLSENCKEIFNSGTNKILQDYFKISTNSIAGAEFDQQSINLNFITPLRIQENGKLITHHNQITTNLFFDLLERRIQIINHLYGATSGMNFQLPINPKEFSFDTSGLFYESWERYSSRQKVKMSLGGLKGTLKIFGKIKDLYPCLKIASLLHLGKNTVFGLGKFEIE